MLQEIFKGLTQAPYMNKFVVGRTDRDALKHTTNGWGKMTYKQTLIFKLII